MRNGLLGYQNAVTHTDRQPPDRLTTTASAQTRESREVYSPISFCEMAGRRYNMTPPAFTWTFAPVT
jgi:hypothetical protein